MKTTKILHSSFACDPAMGSEPYVGWNWAKMISENFSLHVVTRLHHKESIQTSKLRNIHFHYFDLPFCKGLDHRSKFIKPYYILWQIFVVIKVALLHLRNRFSIVHHITYNNLDVPGFLWLLPKTKFVWGPVGGGQVPEAEFQVVYGAKWRKELLRKKLKESARYNLIVYLALKRASLVLFANEDTKRRFEGIGIKRTEMMLETAITSPPEIEQCLDRKKELINILWVGQIEPRKALRIAIDAVKLGKARYKDIFNVHLSVVGDGPDFEEMGHYIVASGVGECISMLGKIPFESVRNYFKEADIFLFTSVQDTSGNVVLEAMSFGVPVIGLNHQGVKEILQFGGGVLIEVAEYETTISRIADELYQLTVDTPRRKLLGGKAFVSVNQNFTWSAKKDRMTHLYKEILV